jgi:hypothetical protein
MRDNNNNWNKQWWYELKETIIKVNKTIDKPERNWIETGTEINLQSTEPEHTDWMFEQK